MFMPVSPKNVKVIDNSTLYISAIDSKLTTEEHTIKNGKINIHYIFNGVLQDHEKMIIKQAYLSCGWKDIKLNNDNDRGLCSWSITMTGSIDPDDDKHPLDM